MSSNYLALRSSAAPTLTVSTLLGSTISTRSITLQSTTISLGQSTNQSYNFSNSSFTTGWASTLTGATSIKKLVLAPNGATQTILQNNGSTMSTVITSLNSGSTWTGSTMRGLPTSGALPYQTYSAINTVPSITAINAAASSGNQLAIASNELVYASNNSGATFTPTGLGQNNNPFIYIPFDGSVTDVMGNSAVTTTGTIAYVPGKVGTQAVNLVNAMNGVNATNYLSGSWSGSANYTASFWFNIPAYSSTQQNVFSAYGGSHIVFINPTSNSLTIYTTSGGGLNTVSYGTTPYGISLNTWYNIIIVFQTGGVCSFYVNNSLIGSMTNSGGVGSYTTTSFRFGTYDTSLGNAFNGYIDDFRLYNYAVTNPSGAALINPLVGPIMPFVYLPFDGSTTTDVMGNSAVTATGSPGYVAGQVGSNALNLVNTAGGTATQYVRGNWTSPSIYTVTGWFNLQSYSATGNQFIFSTGGASGANAVLIYVSTSNQLFAQIPNTTLISTGVTILLNTWYYFSLQMSPSGNVCSLHFNNAVYTATATATGAASGTFGIGTFDSGGTIGAFRGYVDDFRIYNGAFLPSQLSPVLTSPSLSSGSPNIYLPFENGSVLDAMGYSAVSARGTMNFVPGIIGSAALNLVNPAGGTPVNYIRGSWAGSPNSTVSLWFNLQSLGSATQTIFSAYQSWLWIAVTSTGLLGVAIPTGGAGVGTSFSMGTVNISLNTWYHVVLIFQTNALCSFYVNNLLIGTFTNVGGTGTIPSTQFSLGSYDNLVVSAFNGYIDDFKLYNSAVPFHALGPMNYTQAALSNSGAYQVVAAANGGVYTSANSGSTWSQATLASLAVISEVDTVGGQIITPQLTGLAAATWTQNGVNWVASASSQLGGTPFSYYAFQNTNGGNIWISVGNYSSGVYNNTFSTTVLGIGTVNGEWLQIQSSVPLVITSYTFQVFTAGNFPRSYYIVGSSDGTIWYPIQLSVLATNPVTTNNVTCSNNLLVNFNGTQTLTGNISSTVSTTAYATTTMPYTYFRIIVTGLFSTATNAEIGEWYINFTTPPTPLYVAPTAALIGSLSAITVMPQQTGLLGNTTSSTLVATTWTTANGVSWTASASSVNSAGFQPWVAFNNIAALSGVTPYSWATPTVYNTSGIYTGSASTTVVGITLPVSGEWLQIQSSVPLVMSSYTYAVADYRHTPKTGYIVGSTDGTTWYLIQNISMTTNPLTTSWTSFANYIIVNQNGIQTIQGGQTGSGTFTSYPTTTNAYTYFRVIGTSIWPNQYGNLEFTEWFINFTAYTPSLLQSLYMSPAGQNIVLTGAGATAPNVTGLAANTWTANGVNWTASASSNIANVAYAPYAIFNNSYTNVNPLGWADSGLSYNPTTGAYVGLVSTTIQNIVPPAATGVWIQIQSSIPLVLHSYRFATAVTAANIPKTYYLVGSNDGSTWYALQYASLTTNPTTTPYTTCSTNLLVNFTGTQTIQGNQTGSGSTISYSTSTTPFTYFRLILSEIWPSNASVSEIGELYLNFQSGPTFYSTDYGSSWTRALSAATIPNANVLAISGNGQYSLQASGQLVTLITNTLTGYNTGAYTTPTFSPALSSATGSVSQASISATGQYIVLVTQGTTNNVYYSMNYGVSFTGITVGSSAMTSCDMSADGSYLTVANATIVFTLNRNIRGFSVTVGNQAGLMNQGQNAIAIGDKAGQTNQSANSIVLNATGAAVDSYVPGLFVAPVLPAGSSVSNSFAILGYGSDSQVVQSSSLFMGANGNVGIGTAIPNAPLQFANTVANRKIVMWDNGNNDHRYYGFGINDNTLRYQVDATSSNHIFYAGTSATTSNELMRISGNGNVGIGVTNPINKLHVHGGIITASGFTDITKPERTMIMYYANAVDAGVLEAYNYTVGTRYPILINPNGGNVGIGVTNPLYQFQVKNTGLGGGSDRAGSSIPSTTIGSFVRNMTYLTSDRVDIEIGSSATDIGDIGSTYKYRLGMAGTGATTGANFQISGVAISGSYFGADIVSPRFTILPNGTIIFNAYTTTGTLSIVNTAGQVGQSSDRRIKENIIYQTDTQQGLASVLNLKPVTFNFIGSSDSHLGFIAQDVEQDIPLAVDGKKYEWQWEVTEDGKPKFDENGDIIYKLDADGNRIVRPRGLTDRAIIATQTLAIQELSKQATSHAMLVQELSKQNTALTQKLDTLLTWAQTQGFSGTF